MTILISAVEVGSVRSIIPVCIELLFRKQTVLIERRGHFNSEIPKELECNLVNILNSDRDIIEFIKNNSIKVILFSVNIHDPRPLQIARVAKSIGITTIHLLDYWNGYRSRMELDGKKMFKPTRYLVPDYFSKSEAVKEHIPQSIIEVVGQPSFSDLEVSYLKASKKKCPFKITNKKIILFVLEPIEDDQGNSLEENKNYRGYTEYDVIKMIIDIFDKIDKIFRIILVPHPRQDLKKLKKQWNMSGGSQYGSVYDNKRGRDLLPFVDGVIGMASTLLYEAWLLGKIVISIQPGLIVDSLRMLSHKKGITFIDQYESAEEEICNWLFNLSSLSKQHNQIQDELKIHLSAAKNVADNVVSFCDN